MYNLGLHIKNPTATFKYDIVYDNYKTFTNSKYLIKKRDKLRNRFYKRKIFINGFIKWTSTILAGCIGLVIFTYLIYTFNILKYSPSWLGIIACEISVIFGGITYFKLDNIFETDRYWLECKHKR